MRSQIGKRMLIWCNSARGNIDMAESLARQADLSITIHLGAELAATRDAIAELEDEIRDWMKEGQE